MLILLIFFNLGLLFQCFLGFQICTTLTVFSSSHPDKSKTQLSIKQIIAFFYWIFYTTIAPQKKPGLSENITPASYREKNP